MISHIKAELLRSIRRSIVRRQNEQCSQKHNYNIIHGYVFCATKDSTGHTVKGRRSQDTHKWPTRTQQLWASIR